MSDFLTLLSDINNRDVIMCVGETTTCWLVADAVGFGSRLPRSDVVGASAAAADATALTPPLA